MPLAETHAVSVSNNKMGTVLQMLESEEVITLLSELHQVITPLYLVYANLKTGYIDFASFIKFLTDFSVFPDVVNKSEAYKIFMNLAFKHESKYQEYFNFTR